MVEASGKACPDPYCTTDPSAFVGALLGALSGLTPLARGGPLVTDQPLLVSVSVAVAATGPDTCDRTCGNAFCVSAFLYQTGSPEIHT